MPILIDIFTILSQGGKLAISSFPGLLILEHYHHHAGAEEFYHYHHAVTGAFYHHHHAVAEGFHYYHVLSQRVFIIITMLSRRFLLLPPSWRKGKTGNIFT